jgi:prepilin-type N-terminal cleavage/methylation domain-containing protein
MNRSHQLGYSLIELLFVLALVAVCGSVAVPELHGAVDDYRAAGAARYVAAQVQRVRMEAISRSANVALQFSAIGSGYAYATYVDGNGDGVLTKDIKRGVDRPLGAIEHLGDAFPGVEFGVMPGLPPVEAGASAPGVDPIKLGASNLLSFSALGTSSSGSLYIRGRGTAQYVVRVFGETGRTRVLAFNAANKAWRPI